MPDSLFKGVGGRARTQILESGDLVGFFIKDAFKVQNLLLLGAAVQIALFFLLPPRLAIVPAAVMGLYAFVSACTDMSRGGTSSYMRKVVLGRTSAQLPNEDGSFGSEPAVHPVVVFHFGVRFNHPLGLFSPGAQTTIDHFTKCNDLVVQRADEYGMLGLSAWRAAERASDNTLMMVYYFRDVESLNKFAHDDIHRKAWDWIVKAGYKHIGFFHEAFCIPPKAYESIYVNLPPLLIGAASLKCKDLEGDADGDWVQALVNADVGPLRSQFGRMGRGFREVLKN